MVHCTMSETVGQRIKRFRLLKGMTQDALASEVGFEGGSQISNIERGDRRVSTETLQRIARALGVSPREFFVEEPPPPERRAEVIRFSMPGHISTKERERIEELLQNLADLPPEEKDLVYDIIETIFRRRRG